jgi:hypothetical protein
LHSPAKASTVGDMAERDANKEALEQVEKATESKPVKGEDLLESAELKRRLREAKERESANPPRK